MDDVSRERVLTEVASPGVLVITLNRPDRRNAFDSAMARRLEEVADAYDDDPSLRCAVITGAGTAFCAGQDLIAAANGDVAVTERRGGFGFMTSPPAKPVIAAVEGPALAGGFELALACDLIVASGETVMGLPEVRSGLIAVGGGLLRLPRRVPYGVAMEMALTGAPRSARELEGWGLIARVSEPGCAVADAIALAEQIAENAPMAVAASKRVVAMADIHSGDTWTAQSGIAEAVLRSDDLQEGLAAFAAKRRPVWSGR